MSSYVPHFRATTAKQEALRRWSPNQRHKALITALRRIEDPLPGPARMPRFINAPRYWRDRQAAHQAGICWKCNGVEELPVMGILGEYEGTEPCWVCQRFVSDERIPFDDIPF